MSNAKTRRTVAAVLDLYASVNVRKKYFRRWKGTEKNRVEKNFFTFFEKMFVNSKISCNFALTKQETRTLNTMKNYCTLSDEELLKIFYKNLNAKSEEEKAAERKARKRAAKADFFNLDDTDYCKFVEA
jgi:hypothetical protein